MGLIKNNELRGLSVYQPGELSLEIVATCVSVIVLSIQDISMILNELNEEVTLYELYSLLVHLVC